jgi:gluconolactonase
MTPGDGLPGHVWAVDVDTGDAEVMVESGPVFVNGLGFTRDGRTLLVTATLAAELSAYEVAPADAASWRAPRLMHTFDNGWPDGMAISALGEAWVALTAADRIDVIDGAGERTASITVPAGSLPTNVCIGGGSVNELFVTAAHGESLLRIRLDDRGDPALTQ